MVAKSRWLRFEKASEPLLGRRHFLHRLLRHALLGAALILVALALGMAGYHQIVGLPWIDAYENAAMILSGMGPIAVPATTAGKVFAGSYALFSGIGVLLVVGVVAAPLVHRLLHAMHTDA